MVAQQYNEDAFLAVVVCRIPGIWQMPMGNKPIQGSGYSHAYCKPSQTLE
jgi:hypothetical protein